MPVARAARHAEGLPVMFRLHVHNQPQRTTNHSALQPGMELGYESDSSGPAASHGRAPAASR